MHSSSVGGDQAFDVYGYRFSIRGSSRAAVEGLCEDFAFFRSPPNKNDRIIEVLDQEPDYCCLPSCVASVYTPRNVVFRAGDVSYIDYSGRGLAIHDQSTGQFIVYSRDQDLLYESVYLYLISQASSFLDSKHWHRVHALGVSVHGRAILVLLPMGGGKSTLGWELLKYPELKLLSDDSPIVDARGRVHAFPLRIGLLDDDDASVPVENRRLIRRMEFGQKILVSYRCFSDRVCAEADPGFIFLGSRISSGNCCIEPADLGPTMRAMISNSVIGLGLFHGLEFVLNASALELLSKFPVGLSRFANCLSLIRRSKAFHLRLARDKSNNARTLIDFICGVL
ncbi:MAG: hypothetical protein KIT09_35715 [Bryobacteraceae bacterium]|nr:hypothetical protein [Bryobacteraceae bacterium]